MQKLQGGQGFASMKLVTDYLTDGRLPTIHNSIGHAMDKVPMRERLGAVDLGACHGMLSVRARKMGWRPVIGLETDGPSVNVYNSLVHQDSVKLHQTSLNVMEPGFRSLMGNLAIGHGVNTVLARRVIPELFSTAFDWRRTGVREEDIRAFGDTFSDVLLTVGIKWLVLEGRFYSKRTTHPLGNWEAEVACLGPRWTVSARHHSSVLLRPKA